MCEEQLKAQWACSLHDMFCFGWNYIIWSFNNDQGIITHIETFKEKARTGMNSVRLLGTGKMQG
jgi:hypothetical protein